MVDTIGAGDAFMGALLARWRGGGGDQLEEAARFACRVAGLTCARAGADPPLLAELGFAEYHPGARAPGPPLMSGSSISLVATETHLSRVVLDAGVDEVREAPKDDGVLELLVRRPAENERELLESGELDTEGGLAGDNWRTRGSKATEDGSAHPDLQLTLMNARSARLIAGERERWALAGDQLFVDLSLAEADLPPGTRLAVGGALIEITAEPHRGCGKFAARFGVDALKFVELARGPRAQPARREREDRVRWSDPRG